MCFPRELRASRLWCMFKLTWNYFSSTREEYLSTVRMVWFLCTADLKERVKMNVGLMMNAWCGEECSEKAGGDAAGARVKGWQTFSVWAWPSHWEEDSEGRHPVTGASRAGAVLWKNACFLPVSLHGFFHPAFTDWRSVLSTSCFCLVVAVRAAGVGGRWLISLACTGPRETAPSPCEIADSRHLRSEASSLLVRFFLSIY